jgi:hypothetical protein
MRLHAENPELTDEELTDLAMRGRKVLNHKNEIRYEYTCPKCVEEYWVDEKTHEWIQTLDRLPKCSPCYS